LTPPPAAGYATLPYPHGPGGGPEMGPRSMRKVVGATLALAVLPAFDAQADLRQADLRARERRLLQRLCQLGEKSACARLEGNQAGREPALERRPAPPPQPRLGLPRTPCDEKQRAREQKLDEQCKAGDEGPAPGGRALREGVRCPGSRGLQRRRLVSPLRPGRGLAGPGARRGGLSTRLCGRQLVGLREPRLPHPEREGSEPRRGASGISSRQGVRARDGLGLHPPRPDAHLRPRRPARAGPGGGSPEKRMLEHARGHTGEVLQRRRGPGELRPGRDAVGDRLLRSAGHLPGEGAPPQGLRRRLSNGPAIAHGSWGSRGDPGRRPRRRRRACRLRKRPFTPSSQGDFRGAAYRPPACRSWTETVLPKQSFTYLRRGRERRPYPGPPISRSATLQLYAATQGVALTEERLAELVRAAREGAWARAARLARHLVDQAGQEEAPRTPIAWNQSRATVASQMLAFLGL
jgi:hypothetical protein